MEHLRALDANMGLTSQPFSSMTYNTAASQSLPRNANLFTRFTAGADLVLPFVLGLEETELESVFGTTNQAVGTSGTSDRQDRTWCNSIKQEPGEAQTAAVSEQGFRSSGSGNSDTASGSGKRSSAGKTTNAVARRAETQKRY